MALFGLGQKKDLVGLDIGSSSIKVAEIRELKKGRGYQLLNFGVESLPSDAIVDGSILDSAMVIEAIQKIFTDKKIRNRSVAINVAGTAVTIKRISLPRMAYAELAESINLEAEQYLPFGIDDVNIDFRILERPAGLQPEADNNMDVLLVAAKKDRVNEYISVVSQAGLTPMVVDVNVFALQNCYEVNHPIEDGLTVLVDVGYSVTSVNVMLGGSSVFWRDLNTGGKKYNEAIQREMGVAEDQSEAFKRGQTEASGVPVEQVVSLLNGVSEEIVREISKTVEFCRQSTVDQEVARVVLSGGSARVLNFDRVIGEALRAPVEILNPFSHVAVDRKKFDAEWLMQYVPAASVAVGLGLRRIGDF
jgi:type IV pilus assembly protein PilM